MITVGARRLGGQRFGDPFIIGAIATAIPGILAPVTDIIKFFAGGDERGRNQQLAAREQQIRAREAELEGTKSAGMMQTALIIGGGAILVAGLAVVLGVKKKAA